MTKKASKTSAKSAVKPHADSHVEDRINLLTDECCSGKGPAVIEIGKQPSSCCSTAANESGAEAGSCCFGSGETDENGEVDPGYLDEKRRYLARIRRIEGQVRGIHRMVDAEQYCIDVLTQISAVNSALRSLALGLLDAHLHHCVLNAANSGPDELDAKLAEASAAIARLAK